MWPERHQPATALSDSRQFLVTVCFVQCVVALSLVFLVTPLAPQHLLFSLSENLLLAMRLSCGSLGAVAVVSVAVTVAVWTRLRAFLFGATVAAALLLAVVALIAAWVARLHAGVWDAEMAERVVIGGGGAGDVCPGIPGAACCGWDYCPLSACPHADVPCATLVHNWVGEFFAKAMPMLSLLMACGIAQVALGIYRMRC